MVSQAKESTLCPSCSQQTLIKAGRIMLHISCSSIFVLVNFYRLSIYVTGYPDLQEKELCRSSYSKKPGCSCQVLYQPIFPLSIFTFIKRLLNSSSLAAIRVLSSAYLRLLTFLPTILIPACASSSPAFHMMYSVHRDFLVAQMAKRLPAVRETWI